MRSPWYALMFFCLHVNGLNAGTLVLSTADPINTGFTTGGIGREVAPGSSVNAQGQSIIAPEDVLTLDRFSFHLLHFDLSPVITEATLEYRAYVSLWDGIKTVGTPLFASASQFLPYNATTFTKVTFETGGIPVTPGEKYVLYVSEIGLTQANFNRVGIGISPTSLGPAGANSPRFVYSNATTPEGLGTTNWMSGFGIAAGDVAFEAEFTVVPEPTALALVVGGLLFWVRMRHFR